MPDFRPGERFAQMTDAPPGDHGIWAHMGWRLVEWAPGSSVLEWEPTSDHSFAAGDGWIVHGGMVTAILDTALGWATWSLLNLDEVFLTTDLRTEFYRPTLPGLIRAEGKVVHKTRKVTFAAGELFDQAGQLLAGCRATNLTLNLSERPDPGRG